jgi:DUF1680 family protein
MNSLEQDVDKAVPQDIWESSEDTKKLRTIDETDQFRKHIEEIREALEFYANHRGYQGGLVYVKKTDIPKPMDYSDPYAEHEAVKYSYDKGDIAKKALNALEAMIKGE